MNQKFKNCLERQQITKDNAAENFVAKEIKAAENDLFRAGESLKAKDYKWTTIQSYYAAFHSARALLYSQGYRERSHYCLIQAIRALFVDRKKMDGRILRQFEKIKTLREKADYELEFSQTGAKEALRVAEEFLKGAKKLL